MFIFLKCINKLFAALLSNTLKHSETALSHKNTKCFTL